jgi:hypothetical protein
MVPRKGRKPPRNCHVLLASDLLQRNARIYWPAIHQWMISLTALRPCIMEAFDTSLMMRWTMSMGGRGGFMFAFFQVGANRWPLFHSGDCSLQLYSGWRILSGLSFHVTTNSSLYFVCIRIARVAF